MFQADGATIDYIDAVRGGKTDHMRFYRAHWEGTDDTTWASEAQLKSDDELAAIDFFWATNPEIHKSETQECEAEWRCTFAGCCSPTTGSIFEDGDELDAHQQSCVYRPTSRKNTKTLTAMETREEKARICEMEDVLMEGIPIETVYDFQYLGVWFQSDGDQTTEINCRLARASTAFARLRHIWTSAKLTDKQKLQIYGSGVVSILIYGEAGWILNDRLIKRLRGWNAKNMAVIFGASVATAEERAATYKHYSTKSAEAPFLTPEFDIVSKVRMRRLRWLGHQLRAPAVRLPRRVALESTSPYPKGSIFEDAPAHDSINDLIRLAGNHDTDEGKLLALQWRHHTAGLGGTPTRGESRRANTPEQTARAIAEYPIGSRIIYTDGGCNMHNGICGASGWGTCVTVKTSKDTLTVIAELHDLRIGPNHVGL